MSSVTVSSDDFLRAINAAKHIVPSKSVIPIYDCVLLWAGHDGLRISAFSSDHGVETLIPCQGEGVWVLNFTRLAAFCGAIPKGKPVNISGDKVASIRCGSTSARIQSLAAADFPEFGERPSFTETPTWQTGFFATLLVRLAACCMPRPEFPAARSVRVKIAGTNGRAFAINGYVMARQDFVTDTPCQLNLAIDMATAPVVAALFDKGPVWLAQSGSVLWLRNSHTIYRAKTVDVEHPEACGTLEFVPGPTLTADVESLTRALRALAPITSDRVRRVVMNVSSAGSFMAARDEHASLCVPFDCEGEGEVVRFADAEYVRAMLEAAGTETLRFALREKFSNGQETEAITFDGNGFFGLLMPLRANDDEIERVISAWNPEQQEQAAA